MPKIWIDANSNSIWEPEIFKYSPDFHAVCLSRPSGYTCDEAQEKILDHLKPLQMELSRPARLEVNFGLNIPIDHGHRLGSVPKLVNTDGILTKRKLSPIYFQPGDCLPIFLWDPKVHVGGLLHASWKQIPNIAISAVNKMQSEFGSRLENLLVAIGPSIGPCCYRLPKDVTAQITQPWWHDFIQIKDDLVSINLQKAVINSFQSMGVRNIEDSGFCTCCTKFNHVSTFPSYFRDHDQRRFIAAITLT